MSELQKKAGDLPPPPDGSTGRAIVIAPHLTRRPGRDAELPLRTPQARLDEAIGLAEAIDLNVVGSGLVPLSEVRPATFIGTGKVEELAELIRAEHAHDPEVSGRRR